jgi:Fe-S-cluster containining protein
VADQLVQIVDTALASAVARSGPHLECRAGCSQCCYGVFEITGMDAARLREGLALATPETRARIQERIAAARVRLTPFFPGDAATGVLSQDANAIELFEEWAHADPCPILDPETQTCDLYEHRPILCRTFGPPIRNDHEDAEAGLAICELCFTNASEEEILAAEMDSSFRTLEEALEEAHRVAHPEGGPTIIAFAFVQNG